MKIKVKDDKTLERDAHSKAILGKDLNTLNEHRQRKESFRALIAKTQEIDIISTRIDSMESTLNKILDILKDDNNNENNQ